MLNSLWLPERNLKPQGTEKQIVHSSGGSEWFKAGTSKGNPQTNLHCDQSQRKSIWQHPVCQIYPMWRMSRCDFHNKITVDFWPPAVGCTLHLWQFSQSLNINRTLTTHNDPLEPAQWTLNGPAGIQIKLWEFSKAHFPISASLFTARFWQHRWWVLAGAGEHLLADQPGKLQTAHHAGGLVRQEGVCRVC